MSGNAVNDAISVDVGVTSGRKDEELKNDKEMSLPKEEMERKGNINKRPRVCFQDPPAKDIDMDFHYQNLERCVKRSKTSLNADQINTVLEDLDEEIDNALEHTTYKNKLTPANVKSILRHVMANEYVLAMVRNTAKTDFSDEESQDTIPEPKLTRSKAKEMRKKQYKLPWPVSSPAKKVEKVSKKILDEEFPEESSDEDYAPTEEELLRPVKSPVKKVKKKLKNIAQDEAHEETSDEEDSSEEEIQSDDDEVGSSRVGDSSFLKSPESQPTSPILKVLEHYAEDENALVIALPDPEMSPCTSEADKIALRTRSKLCLNDTPLEDIEASFIAPDITMDMYDTKCDNEEWMTFLQELSKPGSIVLPGQPEQEADDTEDDPEYNIQEEEDIPDFSDLRYDSSVQVTRDELNALIAEILEYAQHELNSGEDEEEDDYFRNQAPPVLNVSDLCVQNVQSQWMNTDERLQLDEQMRMYVQLLTQSYLLSHGNSDLNFINVTSKLFLDEIKMFASRELATQNRSSFYAHNLDGALEIVNQFESQNRFSEPGNSMKQSKKTPRPEIQNTQVKKTLVESPVFIYPELLPECGYRTIPEKQKVLFTPAEDNLIALGLEQFSACRYPLYYIYSLLLPTKTERQISIRIKNCKTAKNPLDNPIKYYHTFKEAPVYQRVIRIFDPENVKSPRDFAPSVLPKWMGPFSKLVTSPPSFPTIAPSHQTSPTPIAVVPPIIHPRPEAKRFSSILPRISPLKHISPILKKYNQHRVKFIKRSSPQIPLKIKPKPQVINSLATPEHSLQTTSTRSQLQHTMPLSSPVMSDQSNSVNSAPVNSVSLLSESTGLCNGPIESDANLESKLSDAEGLEEIDEEAVDHEPDSTSNLAAESSIMKKQHVNKKRHRLQRDLEATLKLLQPKVVENDMKKGERETLFANQYLTRVVKTLEDDPDVLDNFLTLICGYQYGNKSPVKLFSEIQGVLKDYPALAEDFVAFLNPEQAKQCGKYKEYMLYCQRREFVRKMEMHFSNQPHKIERIMRTISQVKQQDITSPEVFTALQPLLRNQNHLLAELSHLVPKTIPPDGEEDNSSSGSCENVQIPEAQDAYGGKDCPCSCHNSTTDKMLLNKSRHCAKCAIKFIDGRIYLQTGKVLKPAQVVYSQEVNLPDKSAKIESPSKVVSQGDCNHKQEAESSSQQKLNANEHSSASFVAQVVPPNNSSQVLDVEKAGGSSLPCEVIEHTTFPNQPASPSKTGPSNFNSIQKIISSSETATSSDTNVENNLNEESDGISSHSARWSRDEDKLIIYNCQRHGISKKAFICSSKAMGTRSAAEVEERFLSLMKLLSQELKK